MSIAFQAHTREGVQHNHRLLFQGTWIESGGFPDNGGFITPLLKDPDTRGQGERTHDRDG